MALSEIRLQSTIDSMWARGTSISKIPEDALIEQIEQNTATLFEERTSDLSVHEDANGLTVVCAEDYRASNDNRTILAAHVSNDNKHQLTLEMHHRLQPSHIASAAGYILGLNACGTLIVDTEKHQIAHFIPRTRYGEQQLHEVRAQNAGGDIVSWACAAKILQKLMQADSVYDVFTSSYARRSMLDTHCNKDQRVQDNPAQAFFTTVIQQAVRTTFTS